MPRQTTITAHEKFWEVARTEPGAIAAGLHASYAAIGYLSTWAMHEPRYQNVQIFGDQEGCLHARYSNAQGQPTFVIFGHRREDGTYSFHS